MKNFKQIKCFQIGKLIFIIGREMTEDEFHQWQADQTKKRMRVSGIL